MAQKINTLLILFGDQLDKNYAAIKNIDPKRDAIWMAETDHEISYIPTHKIKITFFLSAMRHFRDELKEEGFHLYYHQLTRRKSNDKGRDFPEILKKDLNQIRPEKVWMIQPGDYRVMEQVSQIIKNANLSLKIWQDDHFFNTVQQFNHFIGSKKNYLLERFYRKLRKEYQVLMSLNDQPEGGNWNYDKQNRESFKNEPAAIKSPRAFQPDDTTLAVIDLVNQRYAHHPGRLDHFDLPVTHSQAMALVRDFVKHRLSHFGKYQDAMWTDQPFLYHSRLSCLLNVKLISPRYVVSRIEEAYYQNSLPLNSVEGFIRQVLGWREYMRGIYWNEMPQYSQKNHLNAREDVPEFFWHGKTRMNCVHHTMKSIIQYSYAHHIQRLMVMGLFGLLWGIDPYKFHQWHMAMYADAVDWVSLPNTLGMSQFADGGLVGTKPYAATGKYINRMSNYCQGCIYNPQKAVGEEACPITSLYWDFLQRNQKKLSQVGRMNLQLKNVERKNEKEWHAIKERVQFLRKNKDQL